MVRHVLCVHRHRDRVPLEDNPDQERGLRAMNFEEYRKLQQETVIDGLKVSYVAQVLIEFLG